MQRRNPIVRVVPTYLDADTAPYVPRPLIGTFALMWNCELVDLLTAEE